MKQMKAADKTKLKSPSLGITDNFPHRAMWKEIADEQGGVFTVKHTKSRDVEIHHIAIPHKRWEIEITVSDTRPLKFNIDFTVIQDFELIISWKDFTDKIFSLFRKSETQMGWKPFDKQYLIKTNRSDLALRLLSEDIQKLMLQHHIYSISYQSNSKSGKAELISVIQRRNGTKKMITELIAMYKMILDGLERLKVVN